MKTLELIALSLIGIFTLILLIATVIYPESKIKNSLSRYQYGKFMVALIWGTIYGLATVLMAMAFIFAVES